MPYVNSPGNRLVRWVSLGCTLAVLAFIFSNSMRNGGQSSMQSEEVRRLLNEALSALGSDWQAGKVFIRKLAHFAEFALLGMSLLFLLRSWGVFNRAENVALSMPRLRQQRALLAAVLGFLTAFLDEALQLFSNWRSPQLTDALIDSLGVVAGVVFLGVIFQFVDKCKVIP